MDVSILFEKVRHLFLLKFRCRFFFLQFWLLQFCFWLFLAQLLSRSFCDWHFVSTISSFRFNGALISSRSFCRSKFNFSRRAYMAQVLASLMTTMALRHAFDVPSGECRIQNVDESMCYVFNSAKRSWTV